MSKTSEIKDRMNIDQEFLDNAASMADSKTDAVDFIASRYLLKAALAGIIVAFGYVVYILLDGNFSTISLGTDVNFQPLGHYFSGWFFGFCLIFIYYSKSELLTSNMMILSVNRYYKRITTGKMFKIMGFCFLGNFLGGLFVGVMLAGSTILTGNEPAIHYLNHVVTIKQGFIADGSLFSVFDLFVRAVFCNFFINLAMLAIYSGSVKSDFGKMMVMLGGVFFFMYLGLEHSIANTVFFTVAAFTPGSGFIFTQAALNVVVVLIGNFVGGGVLIGLYYAYTNDEKRIEKRIEEKIK